MKKRFVLVVLFVLVLCSSVVYAQNQFQGIIDIIEDAFQLVSSIFTLPMFSTPGGAFGFILFLIWVLLVTIFYYGSGALGSGDREMGDRQRVVISVVLATIATIVFHFERDFLEYLLGHWLAWVYFFLILGVVFIIVIFANRITNHWLRALLYFIALLITLNAQQGLVPYLNNISALVNNPVILLIPYEVSKKWK